MQIIDFYDIDFNKKKKKIGELSFVNSLKDIALLEAIKEKILSFEQDKLRDQMELNKIYYMIEEDPWNIIGVISLHKGYLYIDCAEHDDRVIIKSVFPNKICNIINERN